MLVFSEQRLTFLATPKTGTTAIELAVRAHADISFTKGRKHINAARFHGKIAPFLKDAFGIETETVAVMRDPVDQIRSWYRYRARPELEGTPRSTATMSFDDFVLAVTSNDPPEFARIGSQFDFLTDRRQQVAVSHLFAYDNLDALLGFLDKRLGTAIELKRHNMSPWKQAELSAHVDTVLRRARAAEFVLYGQLMAAGGYLQFPTPAGAPRKQG